MAVEPFNSVGGITIGIPPTSVINENAQATFTGLQVTGYSNLGSIGNVIILGGDNGYFLQTDGEGRLTWAPGGNGGGGNGSPGGANTQVQFNSEGNFGGDAGFTYNSTTNILTVSGNIVANNFIGTTSNANFASYAGNVTTSSQPNITSVGTLTNLTVSGNVSASYYTGNGSLLTGLIATNANFANFAGTVIVSSQPNITSVGNLTSLTVVGNANVGNLTANLVTGNLIPSANITYNLGNNTRRWKDLYLSGNSIYIGDVTLTTSGNQLLINGGNGTILAQNLSNVPGANVIGQVANSLVTSTVYTNAQPNITSVGVLTTVVSSGNIVGSNVVANQYFTTLNANITGSATITGALTTGSLNSIGNVNFNSAPNVSLGAVANIRIGGGISGYFLQTDGAGNLSWAVGGGGGGNGTPGGNTTQVQFNDNGTFGASANFTYNPFSYTLAVPTFNTTTVSIANTLTVNTTANLYTTNITGVLTASSNINTSASPNVNLGDVANVHIQGGTNGYVLQTDGTGNLTWSAGGGGGNGVPGGSNTQIQYNDSGVFGGSAYLTFNEDTNTFQVAGNLIANSTQIGAGIYKFSTSSVYAATTASTAANQVLWTVPAEDVSGVDFHIIATDVAGNSRQVSKISSLLLGNVVQWNEYGSLLINGGVGSFDVSYSPGNIIAQPLLQLMVTPDSANSTSYKMQITEYTP